jgi:hypothetical protein
VLARACDEDASDPYAIDGFDRELIKLWVTQAIGRGNADAERWSEGAREHYGLIAPGRTLARDFPIREVRAAALLRHPVLNELWQPEYFVHALNFHEREIISQAMRTLRGQDVPSLPVHDCLMVPVGAAVAAQEALGQTFRNYLSDILGFSPTIEASMKVLVTKDAQAGPSRAPGAPGLTRSKTLNQ